MSQTIDVKRYEELCTSWTILSKFLGAFFLSCANCCKTLGPDFTEQDITRIAKHFRMKLPAFEEMYQASYNN